MCIYIYISRYFYIYIWALGILSKNGEAHGEEWNERRGYIGFLGIFANIVIPVSLNKYTKVLQIDLNMMLARMKGGSNPKP